MFFERFRTFEKKNYMSEFGLYFNLGLYHVLDWQAYDHVLFIVALCAAYGWASWRRLLLLVTTFTLGHTISLFLSHYQVFSVSPTWIEFLIPVTILIAAIYNLFKTGRNSAKESVGLLFVITVLFGLIHGFGFGRYYNQINEEGNLMPLLEFALGIELAQIIIVLGVLAFGYFLHSFFRIKHRDWVMVVSSMVIGMTLPMLIENWPL